MSWWRRWRATLCAAATALSLSAAAAGAQTPAPRAATTATPAPEPGSELEVTLMTFGLGQDRTVSTIEIAWPSGVSQTFSNVAANQFITIDEAKGIVR